MGGGLEPGFSPDRLDRLLQLLAGERGQHSALLADEVMVMAIWIDALEPGGIAADLDPLDQTKALELLEGSVDARPTDRFEAPVYLQRCHRAPFPAQQLDDLPAGAPAPVPGFLETPNCLLGPAHAGDRIRE